MGGMNQTGGCNVIVVTYRTRGRKRAVILNRDKLGAKLGDVVVLLLFREEIDDSLINTGQCVGFETGVGYK